jgi:hypothetical protein
MDGWMKAAYYCIIVLRSAFCPQNRFTKLLVYASIPREQLLPVPKVGTCMAEIEMKLPISRVW